MKGIFISIQGELFNLEHVANIYREESDLYFVLPNGEDVTLTYKSPGEAQKSLETIEAVLSGMIGYNIQSIP